MRRVLPIFAVFSWYILDANSATPWFRKESSSSRSSPRRQWRFPLVHNNKDVPLSARGGGSLDDGDHQLREESDHETPIPVDSSSLSLLGDVRTRHCSDLVLDLRRRSTSGGDHDESLELRQLISRRCSEYLTELRDVSGSSSEASDDGGGDDSSSSSNSNNPKKLKKLPHPKKLLHFLAPKVPAIKHSPDVNLRIHSALSDIDSGVAACIISSVAHLCEMYDKERILQANKMDDQKKPSSAVLDITTDRRFEQLVECVLSGVSVKKRNREALRRKMGVDSEKAEDIEEILDEEDLQESDGLNVRDACRAAYGIAMLGAHHLDSLGGEKVLDLLQALSLRTRELLLVRLKRLRQDDLLSEPELAHLTTEERMNELAEELAEDAATAMWTFACVRACTGLRSVPLFETCCSILCQDPVEMRRRAQENEEESDRKNVGNNDVVDRLARSDATDNDDEEKSQNKTTVADTVISTKDALLDWLSRTQMNDVMWALALHGRENTTASTDEVTLSETAATLGEIAFDRLIEALEEDLKLAERANEEESELASPTQQVEVEEEQSMMVEVVDAAALLASEAQETNQMSAESISKLPVESMTLKSGHVAHGGVQQVQVVDAAALLASTEGHNPMSIETEILVTPPHAESTVHGENQSDSHSDSGVSTQAKSEHSKQERTFSPHDLAGMAWSVTELHDPLRMQVVPIVIKLIAMLGQSGTESLSGADLANLAWAVSRFEAVASRKEAHTPSSLSLSVISWISHSSLERVRNKIGSVGDSDAVVLDQFQPPELGRLLWAVGCVMSTYAQVPDRVRQDGDIHELARMALKTASLNLSLFATEDLLRICWSFLEICGNDEVAFDPSISVSLGRILSTVEQSLYRWERGDCKSFSSGDSVASAFGHEGSFFSSFFGKSRLNQPLLEQTVGDHDDDDDNALAPIVKKSRRPLLRDLSVDPSTLCKAACAFQRLLVKHPEIKGGWKLTNVAIRLLTSKNARLMKECSVHDIVRLCEAAVRSDKEGHGRELITGLFAHKVVQVLNEVLDESDGKKQGTMISIGAASPAEIATLVWALGDLGVKHALPDDSRHSAYKRLRLVTDSPLLTAKQVKSLDLSSASKILRGMVWMKYFQSDSKFLLEILKEVHEKASFPQSAEELCSLAETLAILKEALKSGDVSNDDAQQTQTRQEGAEEENDDSAENGQIAPSVETETVSVEDELIYLCDQLLASIAQQSRGGVNNLSAQELQRLLSVYSLLPFQADDLINDIEVAVNARLPTSGDTQPLIMVEGILKDAREKSESVQKELFQETGSTGMTALKNGIMSLFRSADDDSEETKLLPKELAEMIRDSINSTVEASAALQEMQQTLQLSIDSIGQQNSEGIYFELGRCQELIANYRRIEFSTGTLRSRYDKDRRKDMSNRLLRRFLP